MLVASGIIAVFGAVIGSIATAVAITGASVFASRNAGSLRRMTGFQHKVETGEVKSNSSKARRIFKKHILKQFHGMSFGVLDLQSRVNSFKTKSSINDDDDFKQVWQINNFFGSENKPLRKRYKYETKEVYKNLKGKRLCLICTIAQQIRKPKMKNVVDIMKTNGFMKDPIVGACQGGTYLMPIAQANKGKGNGKTYHSCRYQMSSDIIQYEREGVEQQFEPCKVFGKIIKRNIEKCGSSKPVFSRFSIDYPIDKSTDSIAPDRFVLGCSKTDNIMYQSSKLLMIASACSKLNNNKEIDKIRLVDGPENKERIEIMSREDFMDYVAQYVRSEEYGNARQEIACVNPRCVDFIEGNLNDFSTTACKSIVPTAVSSVIPKGKRATLGQLARKLIEQGMSVDEVAQIVLCGEKEK